VLVAEIVAVDGDKAEVVTTGVVLLPLEITTAVVATAVATTPTVWTGGDPKY
jgi:hypothetical protein